MGVLRSGIPNNNFPIIYGNPNGNPVGVATNYEITGVNLANVEVFHIPTAANRFNPLPPDWDEFNTTYIAAADGRPEIIVVQNDNPPIGVYQPVIRVPGYPDVMAPFLIQTGAG